MARMRIGVESPLDFGGRHNLLAGPFQFARASRRNSARVNDCFRANWAATSTDGSWPGTALLGESDGAGAAARFSNTGPWPASGKESFFPPALAFHCEACAIPSSPRPWQRRNPGHPRSDIGGKAASALRPLSRAAPRGPRRPAGRAAATRRRLRRASRPHRSPEIEISDRFHARSHRAFIRAYPAIAITESEPHVQQNARTSCS